MGVVIWLSCDLANERKVSGVFWFTWSHDCSAHKANSGCRTMDRRICTVLVMYVAVWSLYCHVDAGETVVMKRNYLTKLTMLGRKAGLDADELNKIVLLGLISEEMNEGLVPRDQKYIRWYNIESVNQSGNYLIHLLVNSLSQGTHCQCIEGVVDFDRFTVNISKQRKLEATYCVQKVDRLQNGRSKFRTSSANAINNGSRGKEGTLAFCLHTTQRMGLLCLHFIFPKVIT